MAWHFPLVGVKETKIDPLEIYLLYSIEYKVYRKHLDKDDEYTFFTQSIWKMWSASFKYSETGFR